MIFEEFEKHLSKGFETKKLAQALKCSVNRLNELKRKPIPYEIYYPESINYKAIYDFAIKYDIDLDSLDYEFITTITNKRTTKYNVISVNDRVYLGDDEYGVVDSITEVAKRKIYVIQLDSGRFKPFTAKQLKEFQKELYERKKQGEY